MDGFEHLSRAECMGLLARNSLGRVAFTERALPAIRPVNYSLVGNRILLRAEFDGLGRRLDGQIVAFEVDEVDTARGAGWSVLVTGSAWLVREPDDLMRLDALPLVTPEGAGHDARVCIMPGEISGRRIRLAYEAA